MKFELSIHAKKVLVIREIQKNWVEKVLCDPQKVEDHKKDPDLKRYWRKIPELDNRPLHVVVNFKKEPVIIVTAYIDRDMRGKL